MVKKKSHEEKEEEVIPVEETQENQITTDAEEAMQDETSEKTENEEKKESGDNLLVKLTEMQDKYLRLSAEFDNYRKRTLREKIELAQTGGETVIVKLLPVIDDIDRAMISIRASEDCDAVRKGLELIYNKVNEFLRQNGVKEIKALNEPFNSDHHEAVTSISVDDDAKKGIIIDVTQKGYTLNDKVIRFPKVIVGE